MARRPTLIPALAALVLLLVAEGAGAHTNQHMSSAPVPVAHAASAPASALAAAPAAPGFPWALLVLVAFAPAFVRRRSLKLATLTLAVALTVFAFETAFHSIHHGLGQEAATACPIASASTHVGGTSVGLVAFDVQALPVGPALFGPGLVVPRSSSLSPNQGRAPPSALV